MVYDRVAAQKGGSERDNLVFLAPKDGVGFF